MNKEFRHYASLLDEIKNRIRQAQNRAVMSANREMLLLYWDVGRLIDRRQKEEGWGAGVIPRLSRDIKNELPEIKGYSERNLKRMIRFFREYPLLRTKMPQPVAQLSDQTLDEKVPQPVAQLPEKDGFPNLQRLVAQIPFPALRNLKKSWPDRQRRRGVDAGIWENGCNFYAVSRSRNPKAVTAGRPGK